MRHRKKFNHLSRTSSHRKAMLANMASSLILHKRITTTTAKAKELRTFVEPIITRSKEDSTHSRRMVFKNLRDKYAVSELFREVATKVGERPGGYTRIIKLGYRHGDNADMCIIELVDYNENLMAEKAAATKPKSSRRRRGGKKAGAGEQTVVAAAVKATESGAEVEEIVELAAGESTAEVEASEESVAEAIEEATDEAETDAETDTDTEAKTGEEATAEAMTTEEAATEPEAAAKTEEIEETGEARPEEDEDKKEKKED